MDGVIAVDVECGTGVAIGPFLERLGEGQAIGIGIDFAPKMIERARASQRPAGPVSRMCLRRGSRRGRRTS